MSDVTSQFDYLSMVMARFLKPCHAGSLALNSDTVSTQAGSRQHGASIRLWLQVSNRQIVRARFQAYGCPHFIAAAEMLCECVEGKSVDALQAWRWQVTESELAIPASKRRKLLLLEDVARQAIVEAQKAVIA